MKKTLFIFVALLLVGGLVFAATPGYRQSPGTGTIVHSGGYQSDATKTFRMVRWNPYLSKESTLSAGSIVIWNHTSADDGVTITTSIVSGDSSVAGIVVVDCLSPDDSVYGNAATQDVGKKNWTWLQTYGKSDVYVGGQAGQVAITGGAMGVSITRGRAGQFVPTGASIGQGNAGFFYDGAAIGTSGTVECFLKCE